MEFNLADLFEGNVDAVPDKEAVVCGGRRLTYAELDAHANRLAHYFASRGIGSGDHIGLQLYNGTEYVEAMLAALKLRAVPVNVNYRYVEDELRYLFTDADLVAVVHSREFGPRNTAVVADTPRIHTFLVVDDGSDVGLPSPARDGFEVAGYEAALAASSPERDFGPRSADDLFIIYTGGTTGMPKGVMWRQEDLFFAGLGGGNPTGAPIERAEELADAAKRPFQLTMFPVAPLIHGAAQLGVFIGLDAGDRVVLNRRFDPGQIWQTVHDEKVNTISIVGDAMARPMAETLEARSDEWDVSSLLVISSAGALWSEVVKEHLASLLPEHTGLIDAFGSTETGFQGLGAASGKQSLGTGLKFQMNQATTVLDDDLRPVEPGSGVVGKVALSGHIPLGYYNDPEKTARTFVEVDGERWSVPGDFGTVEADGTIRVFGRGSLCINTGGEKVYVEEVEDALKAHPAVFDAVVVGIADERFGERVGAVVQPQPGVELSSDTLEEHARGKLAGYKVPKDVFFVDEVRRGPNGKADYPWAKQLAAELSGV